MGAVAVTPVLLREQAGALRHACCVHGPHSSLTELTVLMPDPQGLGARPVPGDRWRGGACGCWPHGGRTARPAPLRAPHGSPAARAPQNRPRRGLRWAVGSALQKSGALRHGGGSGSQARPRSGRPFLLVLCCSSWGRIFNLLRVTVQMPTQDAGGNVTVLASSVPHPGGAGSFGNLRTSQGTSCAEIQVLLRQCFCTPVSL